MEERYKLFTVLISSASRSIKRIKTDEMAEFDLKSPHVSCLYYLYKADGLTSKELCDICGEDKANISRSIKYLEANGYVYCNSKWEKRYQTPIKLTKKGEDTAKKVAEKIDNIVDLASRGLDENDRQIFYKSLNLICENLERFCDENESKNTVNHHLLLDENK